MVTSVNSHVPLVAMEMSVLAGVPAVMGTVPQWMEHVTVIQVILGQLVMQVCV